MRSETIHTPECRELADALWSLAEKAVVKDAHWIATPNGEYQPARASNEWCRDCGYYMVRHLRRQDRGRREDYLLDGGWVSEHGSPIRCAHCGVRLRCNMLPTGAAEELEYFSENHPRPGNPDDAYDFHEVLTALEYVREADAGLVEEALVIGRELVAITQGAPNHDK